MDTNNADITPPLHHFNGHLQTIFPSMFRRVDGVSYYRERIDTPDGDFLDLDWSLNNSSRLLIVCHGLEGNTQRGYVKGMVRMFQRGGWDVLAWNYRGCSEEINKKPRFYHSGATDDLETVIQHALNGFEYRFVSLLGFSLGGNMVLKYLGEKGDQLPDRLQKSLVFSVPLDLYGGCKQISQGFNRIYSYRFLRKLKRKVKRKAVLFPHYFNLKKIMRTRSLIAFDDMVTGPLHGFQGALDYYEKCSAIHFLDPIKIPVQIINARNDPFLSPSCYPVKELKHHPMVKLLVTPQGGHCGFKDRTSSNPYWSEQWAWNYLNS